MGLEFVGRRKLTLALERAAVWNLAFVMLSTSRLQVQVLAQLDRVFTPMSGMTQRTHY